MVGNNFLLPLLLLSPGKEQTMKWEGVWGGQHTTGREVHGAVERVHGAVAARGKITTTMAVVVPSRTNEGDGRMKRDGVRTDRERGLMEQGSPNSVCG